MSVRTLFVALLAASLAAPAPAQSPKSPVFSAGIQLVNLDISVTDNTTHRFVEDLTADDFVIKEGGDDQPQRIVSFERQERPVDLTILVDVSGSMDRVLEQTRMAVIELAKTMRPEDQVRAIFFATHTRVICPFTSDPKVLEAALAGISTDKDNDAQRLRRALDDHLAEVLQLTGDHIKKKNPGLSDEQAVDIARAVVIALADVSTEVSPLKDTLTAVRDILTDAAFRTHRVLRKKLPAMSGSRVDTLTHDVLLDITRVSVENGTTNMQRAIYEQLEDLRRHADGQNRRKVLITLTDGLDNDPLANDDWLLAKAHQSNVAAYTILLQPVLGYGVNSPEKELATHALWLLNTMAGQTGGRLVILKLSYQDDPANPAPLGREVTDAFARIGQELRTQYRVGYEPRLRSSEGTFKTIRVALPNRTGLTVHHRSGYQVRTRP